MTRKDFVLIAAALLNDAAHLNRDERTSYQSMTDWEKGAYDQWNTQCLAIADVLRRTNERFDHGRFLTACGVNS